MLEPVDPSIIHIYIYIYIYMSVSVSVSVYVYVSVSVYVRVCTYRVSRLHLAAAVRGGQDV